MLEETVEALKALAVDPAWRARGFLPGLRDMARMAGCSHYTMWKAVKILEGRGMLEVRPGRRIRIPKSQDGEGAATLEPEASEPVIQYKWERLKRQIEMDILSGTIRPGDSLPTLKEMGVRYGASFLTLKKALRGLEGGSILNAGAGVYSVVPLRPPPRSVLVYFAWGDEQGQLKFWTPFEHEILGSLGNECARTGIRMEKVIYATSGDKLLFLHGRKASATLPEVCQDAFGFLVRTVCSRDIVPELVPRLIGLGKPVGVLDEMGSPHFPRLQGRYPNLAVFRHTISGSPARQMGAYLAGLGHRELAFISPFHGTIWSKNRFDSLHQCFRDLGPAFKVHPHILDIEYQLPGEGHWAGEGPVEALSKSLEKTRSGWKRGFPPLSGILDKLRAPLNNLVWQEWVLEKMIPVFEHALRRREVTAWVAADDDTALLALEYLRRKGLRPPRDLALVGFDDTAEGARQDLTSYNFDFPRFFHGVVIRLLDPPSLPLGRSRLPIEIDGRIVERGSSRLPPVSRTGRPGVLAGVRGDSRAFPALPSSVGDTLPPGKRRKRG